MPITSIRNPLLQAARLAQSAGRPTESGLIVAEGPHLLSEAIRSPWTVEQILGTSSALDRFGVLLQNVSAEVVEVSEKALAAAAHTEASQGLLFFLRPKRWSWSDIHAGAHPTVVLDGIQDPGNAGTIIRSAEAFGASGVVLLKGTVRLANSKFIRASAGSVFRMPCLESVSPDELLGNLHGPGLPWYALTAGAPFDVSEADLSGSCVLLIGSEGRGISPGLEAAATAVGIRTLVVESLNAGVASSIALYEASRQRNRS